MDNNIKGVLSKFHENCVPEVKEYALSFLGSEWLISGLTKSGEYYKKMGKRVIINEMRPLFTIIGNRAIIDGIVEKTLRIKAEKHIEKYTNSKRAYGSEKNEEYKIDDELGNLKKIFKRTWKVFKFYKNSCNFKDVVGLKLDTERYDVKMISHKEILKNLQKIFMRGDLFILEITGKRLIPNFYENIFVQTITITNCFKNRDEKLNEIKKLEFCDFKPFKLPLKVIRKFRQLESLWCIYGNLRKVPYGIGDFLFLTNLNLSYNKLEEIDPNIWRLRNLKNFNLRGNCIKELPYSMIALKNLKILMIVENAFQKLPYILIGLGDFQIHIEEKKLEGLKYEERGFGFNNQREKVLTIKSRSIREKEDKKKGCVIQ